jgi:hypothetical protein
MFVPQVWSQTVIFLPMTCAVIGITGTHHYAQACWLRWGLLPTFFFFLPSMLTLNQNPPNCCLLSSNIIFTSKSRFCLPQSDPSQALLPWPQSSIFASISAKHSCVNPGVWTYDPADRAWHGIREMPLRCQTFFLLNLKASRVYSEVCSVQQCHLPPVSS